MTLINHSKTKKCDRCKLPMMHIGRERIYSKDAGDFLPWKEKYICKECQCQLDSDGGCYYQLSLSRGGILAYYPGIISEEERRDVSDEMEHSDLFRQYRTNGLREPRVHVLLSSHAQVCSDNDNDNNNNQGKHYHNHNHDTNMQEDGMAIETKRETKTSGPGYGYHNVKMKALPLSLAPVVEKVAKRLANKFRLPNNEWGIGANLITYRDGSDKIGWHADDTQGEYIILTVVAQSNKEEERRVHIRPKRQKNKAPGGDGNGNVRHVYASYLDGDEEIELIVNSGNGYKMDGTMQEHYEHCVPRKPTFSSRRKVIVFRHGVARNCQDNGIETDPDYRPKRIWFGAPSHMSSPYARTNVSLGTSLLSRVEVSDINVHE